MSTDDARSGSTPAAPIHDDLPEPEIVTVRNAAGEPPRAAPRVHAAESYFVLGEGLLTESAGGRPNTVSAESAASVTGDPPFRFSRMGSKGQRLPASALRALAQAMTRAGGGETGIPAGYTYLGQFVDHDLTMDRTSVMIGASIAPADMIQGRSPSLDLDSLYGSGPQEPGSEKFYAADGLRLKIGKTDDGKPFDLPRKGKAVIIPDHRNDENLAVAQTHLAFIKFHNRVIASLESVPEAKRFAQARRAVVKHYQWMIRHDYLPRICSPSVVEDVFRNGRKVFEPGAKPSDVPTMPIEFSVAAYRLRHSMLRAEYQWNSVFQDGVGTLQALFNFSGTSGTVTEDNPLPGVWPIDWRRFFDFAKSGHAGLKAAPGRFNLAKRIDSRIVAPLGDLPLESIGLTKKPDDELQLNLAFRNLMRGRLVSLASGQEMVASLKQRGATVTPLSKDEILEGAGGADLRALTKAQLDAIAERTPLWFYVLREAELNGGKLNGVGARILAETFHRAMQGSQASIVRDREFRPRFGSSGETFDMADLLFFAFDGNKDGLSPVA